MGTATVSPSLALLIAAPLRKYQWSNHCLRHGGAMEWAEKMLDELRARGGWKCESTALFYARLRDQRFMETGEILPPMEPVNPHSQVGEDGLPIEDLPIPKEDLDDEAPASQAPAESPVEPGSFHQPVEPVGVAGNIVVDPAVPPVEPGAARHPVEPGGGAEGAAPNRKKSRGEVLLEATGVLKGAVKSVFK